MENAQSSETIIYKIPVRMIYPPHPVNDRAKHAAIIESMAAVGWDGRPLLVAKIDDDDHYMALTGSHRIQAAINTALGDVPCVVIDFGDSGYHAAYCNSYPYYHIADTEGFTVQCDPDEYMRMLVEVGDAQAVALMQIEIDLAE